MPIYEYQCKKCKHRFERIQQFSDLPIRKCPQCRSGRVEKLLSSPAVHFKGSGWYVTDYARKGSGGKGKDKDDKGGKESGKESDKESGKESVKEGDQKVSTGDSSSKGASGKKDKKS